MFNFQIQLCFCAHIHLGIFITRKQLPRDCDRISVAYVHIQTNKYLHCQKYEILFVACYLFSVSQLGGHQLTPAVTKTDVSLIFDGFVVLLYLMLIGYLISL